MCSFKCASCVLSHPTFLSVLIVRHSGIIPVECSLSISEIPESRIYERLTHPAQRKTRIIACRKRLAIACYAASMQYHILSQKKALKYLGHMI